MLAQRQVLRLCRCWRPAGEIQWPYEETYVVGNRYTHELRKARATAGQEAVQWDINGTRLRKLSWRLHHVHQRESSLSSWGIQGCVYLLVASRTCAQCIKILFVCLTTVWPLEAVKRLVLLLSGPTSKNCKPRRTAQLQVQPGLLLSRLQDRCHSHWSWHYYYNVV